VAERDAEIIAAVLARILDPPAVVSTLEPTVSRIQATDAPVQTPRSLAGPRTQAIMAPLQVARSLVGPRIQATSARLIQRIEMREVTVQPTVMERLRLAQRAIRQVNNEILKFGAGNQEEDIRRTKGAALHRTKIIEGGKDIDWTVTRDLAADEMMEGAEPARRAILLSYYGASVCDDFGYATFNYLRQIADGQVLTRASSPGLSHAYVIIGNLAKDKESELVVADPWPTSPQACRWIDFFGYCDDLTQLNIKNQMKADGKNVHDKVKDSVDFKKTVPAPDQQTAGTVMPSIIADLGNADQLTTQPGGRQHVESLQDVLINSIKFDDRAITAFVAHVAAHHKSARSHRIEKFFTRLTNVTPDDRRKTDVSASKRKKVIALLLEFAATPQGMAFLIDGYVEGLISTQPDKFVWAHSSTLQKEKPRPGQTEPAETRPIFYTDANWTVKHKKLMRDQFEKDLEANRHVPDKALAELFPTV
jgi:hypothetical protein